ncbi:MAG TPA: cytochrome c-type biogenesis protein CcmH [Candidatus Binatia bacterium]|nr:cytochrome c-type biogenesis protein CcmH [Candidatus Binatia bacterium]
MGAALAALAMAVALLVGRPHAARAADDATQTQIETDLTCQCGCGLTVHACNHLNCSSGIPLKEEIAQQIASGRSRSDILSYFQTKYGEKILSSPTATGFNLAAWTVPFAAIAVGGVIVALALARWRRTTPGAAAESTAAGPAPVTDPALRARLDSALEDFERRS